ncbi:DNA translocase FtsK [Gossypium arboreum]|uniref:DNA translocase FtsK n=1 Tax=Gossypium arboreum TaxID=29729 RepID=A0A0B0PGP0_GOSAR|nr:DNA translocase FtsK [Gossypium arboreum]
MSMYWRWSRFKPKIHFPEVAAEQIEEIRSYLHTEDCRSYFPEITMEQTKDGESYLHVSAMEQI